MPRWHAVQFASPGAFVWLAAGPTDEALVVREVRSLNETKQMNKTSITATMVNFVFLKPIPMVFIDASPIQIVYMNCGLRPKRILFLKYI